MTPTMLRPATPQWPGTPDAVSRSSSLTIQLAFFTFAVLSAMSAGVAAATGSTRSSVNSMSSSPPSTGSSFTSASPTGTAIPSLAAPTPRSDLSPASSWWPSWLAVNWLVSSAPSNTTAARLRSKQRRPTAASQILRSLTSVSRASTRALPTTASPSIPTATEPSTSSTLGSFRDFHHSPPPPTHQPDIVSHISALPVGRRFGPIERPGPHPTLDPPARDPDPVSSATPGTDPSPSEQEPDPFAGIFLAPVIDPDPLPLNDTVLIPVLATATPSFLGVPIVPPRATVSAEREPSLVGPSPPPSSSARTPSVHILHPDPPLPSATLSPSSSSPTTPASNLILPADTIQPRPSNTSAGSPPSCGNNVCDATDSCSACPQDCSFARPVLVSSRHLPVYERALDPLHRAASAGSQRASETLQLVQRIVDGFESKTIACNVPHVWQACQRADNGKQTAAVVVMGEVHPHPVWTVKAADTLKQAGVSSTFFLNPYRLMAHGHGHGGYGRTADLPSVRRAVRHVIEAGHTLGLLATESPISVAALAFMHDVYSRLPTWLLLPDSDTASGVLDVPPPPTHSVHFPSWAPTGLHVAAPMYLTYPSLPLTTTRALLALNATLIVPTFPFHESSLTRLLMPDLASTIFLVDNHLTQLKSHAGVPGWIVSIESSNQEEIDLVDPIIKVLRERVGVTIVEGGIKGCDADRVGASVAKARQVVAKLGDEAREEPVVSVGEGNGWQVVFGEGNHPERDEFLLPGSDDD